MGADTVAGFDVSGDDVGCATVCISQHAAILGMETAVQGADAAGSEHFRRVAVTVRLRNWTPSVLRTSPPNGFTHETVTSQVTVSFYFPKLN